MRGRFFRPRSTTAVRTVSPDPIGTPSTQTSFPSSEPLSLPYGRVMLYPLDGVPACLEGLCPMGGGDRDRHAYLSHREAAQPVDYLHLLWSSGHLRLTSSSASPGSSPPWARRPRIRSCRPCLLRCCPSPGRGRGLPPLLRGRATESRIASRVDLRPASARPPGAPSSTTCNRGQERDDVPVREAPSFFRDLLVHRDAHRRRHLFELPVRLRRLAHQRPDRSRAREATGILPPVPAASLAWPK